MGSEKGAGTLAKLSNIDPSKLPNVGFLRGLSQQDQASDAEKTITAEQESKRSDMEKQRIKLARQRGTGLLSNVNVPSNTLG